MGNLTFGLLNEGTSIASAVLDVLAIVGLVAAAAFVIIFVSDLFLSISDSKNGIFFKRKSKDNVKTLQLTEFDENVQKEVPETKSEIKSNVDLELAEAERLEIQREQKKILEQNDELKERIDALEAKQNKPVETEKEDEQEFSEDELDKMYAELMSEINKEKSSTNENSNQATEEDEQAELDRLYKELMSDLDNETNEDEEDENTDEEQVEVVEDFEPAEDEKIDNSKYEELENQIEELKKLLSEEKQAKDDLNKKLQEKILPTSNNIELGSLDELLSQKAELEERLKDVSRELKLNKKEYIPLARIKKTLEKDEAKLRRREAIVAKKKIMLFGVTNYVVDPEKEQELSQDLDQLEALRLSVQHCEEVMTENKDRYPLLENTNKILKKTIEDIKSDLEIVEQKIATLNSKNGNK